MVWPVLHTEGQCRDGGMDWSTGDLGMETAMTSAALWVRPKAWQEFELNHQALSGERFGREIIAFKIDLNLALTQANSLLSEV
ncbi:hypothetical protein RRG08_015907 [Elysia crispata]|uniref:Uncharacterized protein n=1 Tax=Elysia crispata TaxID=231223 RepID=A0AAE1E2H8_9GAST|nr:hypothetical protein RRG08_015907 [Elysia crispata]